LGTPADFLASAKPIAPPVTDANLARQSSQAQHSPQGPSRGEPTRRSWTMKSPKLTAAKRNGFAAAVFGLPSQRKYPLDTPGRAANAKARATQQVAKGNLTPAQRAQIDARANRVLGRT